MPRLTRFAVRSLLLAAAAFTATAAPQQPAAEAIAAPEAVTSSFKEVRIRKLHLVRPDLIPYPLAYEVLC